MSNSSTNGDAPAGATSADVATLEFYEDGEKRAARYEEYSKLSAAEQQVEAMVLTDDNHGSQRRDVTRYLDELDRSLVTARGDMARVHLAGISAIGASAALVKGFIPVAAAAAAASALALSYRKGRQVPIAEKAYIDGVKSAEWLPPALVFDVEVRRMSVGHRSTRERADRISQLHLEYQRDPHGVHANRAAFYAANKFHNAYGDSAALAKLFKANGDGAATRAQAASFMLLVAERYLETPEGGIARSINTAGCSGLVMPEYDLRGESDTDLSFVVCHHGVIPSVVRAGLKGSQGLTACETDSFRVEFKLGTDEHPPAPLPELRRVNLSAFKCVQFLAGVAVHFPEFHDALLALRELATDEQGRRGGWVTISLIPKQPVLQV